MTYLGLMTVDDDTPKRNPALVKIGNHALGDLVARLLEDHAFQKKLPLHEANRLRDLMGEMAARADAAIRSAVP